MADVNFIGSYQLENLHRQQVRFIFLDLRDDAARAGDPAGHPLMKGSQAVAPDGLLRFLEENGIPGHAPIVLISENDGKSVAAAQLLEENSFINVFVVEGGTKTIFQTG